MEVLTWEKGSIDEQLRFLVFSENRRKSFWDRLAAGKAPSIRIIDQLRDRNLQKLSQIWKFEYRLF